MDRHLSQHGLDTITNLESCYSRDNLIIIYSNYIGEYGFNFFVAGEIYNPILRNSEINIISNWPIDWVNHYFDQNYLLFDAVPKYAFSNMKPVIWSKMIQSGSLTKIQRLIFNESFEIGLTDGYIMPIHSDTINRGGISISSNKILDKIEKKNEIEIVSNIMYSKFLNIINNELKNTIKIKIIKYTKREIECLSFSFIGKSDWEIGNILSISEKTVNYHIENAKRKSNSCTRSLAISRAVLDGSLIL